MCLLNNVLRFLENYLLYNYVLFFSLKICKAVLVGDVAVGKTCLVNR